MPTITLTHDQYAAYEEFLFSKEIERQHQLNNINEVNDDDSSDALNQESSYKGTFYVDPNCKTITEEPQTKENTYDVNSSLLIPTKFKKWKLDTKTRTTIVGTVEVFADTEETPTACVFYDGQTNSVGVYDYGVNEKIKHRCKEMIKRCKRSPDLDPSSKTTMRLVLLEVYPTLKGNRTNKPHLYPLTDYKNALDRMFTTKAECEKFINSYKMRNPQNEAPRYKKMMNAIDWYPKPLELLNIPQNILKRAEARHKVNLLFVFIYCFQKHLNSAHGDFVVEHYHTMENRQTIREVIETTIYKLKLTSYNGQR